MYPFAGGMYSSARLGSGFVVALPVWDAVVPQFEQNFEFSGSWLPHFAQNNCFYLLHRIEYMRISM
jgi:hypothetical protein